MSIYRRRIVSKIWCDDIFSIPSCSYFHTQLVKMDIAYTEIIFTLHLLAFFLRSSHAHMIFSRACIGVGARQGRIPKQLNPAAIDQNLANHWFWNGNATFCFNKKVFNDIRHKITRSQNCFHFLFKIVKPNIDGQK